eukprot:13476082-Alexandrium_andersonii.AAC.1
MRRTSTTPGCPSRTQSSCSGSWLFGPPQRCWDSGRTRFILGRLAVPAMVLVGNAPKTIGWPGAVDDATKQRCVARLSA